MVRTVVVVNGVARVVGDGGRYVGPAVDVVNGGNVLSVGLVVYLNFR